MTPTYEEFYEYFEEKVKKHGDDAKNYTEWLETKFESWSLNGWKKEKGTKLIPIKNWRSTLLQCIPYRMPNKVKNIKVVTDPVHKKITKLDEIEIERIVTAFSSYKVMSILFPPKDECYNYLLEIGVFQRGDAISEKTGKPWQEWYNKLTKRALPLAVAYAIDMKFDPKIRNEIRNGRHELAEKFVKLEALKTYFDRFETEDQIKSALSQRVDR